MQLFLSTPSDVAKAVWQKIPFHIKVTFFIALFFGLLTHGFMLTNKLPNHDELYLIITNLRSTSAVGRWFMEYPAALSSVFSAPLVNGFLVILYISVASSFLVSCLKINNIIVCMLISGLMVTTPTVATGLSYMGAADASAFGLMLACLAAFLPERCKYGFLIAIVPLVLSLGCYQAYFPVTTALFIIVLITDVTCYNISPHGLLLKSVRFFCTLAASIVIYFIVVKATRPDDSPKTYHRIDEMGMILFSDFPRLICRAYVNIFNYFFKDPWGIHGSFIMVIFALSAICCIYILTKLCVQKKIYAKTFNFIFLILLLVILPLLSNSVVVMAPGIVSPHLNMVYAVICLPIFCLTITASYCQSSNDNKAKNTLGNFAANVSCWVIIATTMMCVCNYFVVSNIAYLKLYFAYEQTYARSVVLMTRIQSLKEYAHDTEIVLVGNPYREIKNFRKAMPAFDDLRMTGILDSESLMGGYSYTAFFHRFQGFTTNRVLHIRNDVLDDTEVAAIVAKMPQYPDFKSIAMIKGKIYVKFSAPKS